MDSVRRLIRHPLFAVGLVLRLGLLLLIVSKPAQEWYVPFITHSIAHPSLDPWASFLAAGGDRVAFPYGYAMWLTFLPLSVLALILQLPASIGYGATLLAADIAMLAVLRWVSGASERAVLVLYWLSPIVLFATYWLGLNDLIPVLLLMLALVSLREMHPVRSAVFLALAVTAKLSMIIATPFLLIYLVHNKRLRVFLVPFATAFTVALLFFGTPQLLSTAGREMLFDNPEMTKVYEISLPFGDGPRVYLLPLAYLLVLFGAWRVRRMSFELLLTLVGIGFFAVLLLSPALPGWFVWVLPFLTLYQAKSSITSMMLVATFSVAYIGLSGLLAPLPSLPLAGGGWPAGAQAAQLFAMPSRFLSLWQTLLLASGLIVAARMLRDGVQANEYFRLSRRPFVMGISGDSGTGKDTLADVLAGLFGAHSVVRVSGDDYHLWDRHRPMWQVMTHLNPRANDLARFTHDVQALANGRPVQARHYDHESGRMSKLRRVESNHFILVSGLHALYLPQLRELYDIKIFLAMDENLRRHLKIQRDVVYRGYSEEQVAAAFVRREPDARRFIHPQAAHADLVLSLQPIHPDSLVKPDTPLRLKLGVRACPGVDYEDLVRVLVGVCGLHVDLTQSGDGAVELTIEGESDSDDIAFAARGLLPQLNELLDIAPGWHGGMLGVMQLLLLTHVTHALRARLL